MFLNHAIKYMLNHLDLWASKLDYIDVFFFSDNVRGGYMVECLEGRGCQIKSNPSGN